MELLTLSLLRLFVVVTFSTLSVVDGQYNHVIKIDSGFVRGLVNDRAVVYKGIPFAKANRFELPQKPASWNETFNATKFGPFCPQYTLQPGFPARNGTSENCLNLNIYAPAEANSTSALPVLVYVHGGAFLVSLGVRFDGSVLAKEEKVIVVTFNYRVGAFGFLTDRNSSMSAYIGLNDAKAALEWVQRNIMPFGGSPEMVTVAGLSSGAYIASLMTLTRHWQGLYRRVILMSGTALTPYAILSEAEGAERVKMFGELVGCNTKIKACLMNKTVGELVEALTKVRNSFPQPPLAPVTHADPKQIIMEGRVNKTDIMIGMVTEESAYLREGIPGYQLLFNFTAGMTQDEFQNITNSITFLRYSTASTRKAIVYEYTNWAQRNDPISTLKGFLDLAADFLTRVPAIITAQKFAAKNSSVYVYQMEHREPTAVVGKPYPAWMRTPPHEQLVYLFGLPVASNASKAYGSKYRKQIANFMRTGNPNSNQSQEEWPKFTTDSQRVYRSRPNPVVSSNFLADKVGFWSKYLPTTTMMPPHTTRATTTTTPPKPTTKDDEVKTALIVLTAIFGALLLICLIVIIALCVRTRQGEMRMGRSLDVIYDNDSSNYKRNA